MNNAVSETTALARDYAFTGDGEILTIGDVARFLRVPKSTVYKLARIGELPASKIGKHWRFLRRDIHEWMRSRSSLAVKCEVEYSAPLSGPQNPITDGLRSAES